MTPRETVLCSCGCAEPHVIARRATADDVRLAIWSDGQITHGLGTYLRGLGTPRSAASQRARAESVKLVMDDFGVFDAREIPALVKAAEGCYRHAYSSESRRRTHVLSIAQRRLRAAS